MSDFNPTKVLDNPVVLGSSEGTSEVQKVTLAGVGSGKTWKLALDGEETGTIEGNGEATAAEVKTKLEALSNVGPGNDHELESVAGATGGPFTVTFAPEDGDVPQMTGSATEGTATVTTVTQGESPADAVTVGTGDADRTGDVSPLTGESPSEFRENNGSDFGDS